MKEKKFEIDGITCHHCVMAVEKELALLKLETVRVEIGSAEVQYDENKTSEQNIARAIAEAGYRVTN